MRLTIYLMILVLTPGVFPQSEVDTKRDDPTSRLASNDLGVSLFLDGKYEEAIAAFERSIKIHPKFAMAYYNLGTVFAQIGRYAEAITAMKEAVELDPKHIKARTKLCDIYLSLDQFEAAAECYKRLLPEVRDDAQSHSNYGVALLRSKRAKASVLVFEDVVQRYSPTFEWYNNLGVALLEIRAYERAANALEKAIELQPNNEFVRYNFAIALLANKDRRAALEQYGFLKNTNATLAEQLFKAISNGRIIAAGPSISRNRPAH